jgi:hypothetical protein
MQPITQTAPVSKTSLWVGRVLSALMGVLLWGGLLFTDERLRTVFPLRR